MFMMGLKPEARDNEHTGFFTGAEAMEIQAELERDGPCRVMEGDDRVSPVYTGGKLPEGKAIYPVLEVFHEHGDAEDVQTVRLHAMVTEKGAGRMLSALQELLEGLGDMKPKHVRKAGKLADTAWRMPEGREKDRFILLGCIIDDEDAEAGDLDTMVWFVFPARKKKYDGQTVASVFHVLSQSVAMHQAAEGRVQ